MMMNALQRMKTFSFPSNLPEIGSGERRRFLVEATPEYEILLMQWGGNATTPIHDHNDSRCWMRLLEGKLTETTYRGETPEPIETNVFQRDLHLFIEDNVGYHRLTNPEASQALSLHLYAKPLRTSRFYDEDLSLWRTCELTIDGDLREKLS